MKRRVCDVDPIELGWSVVGLSTRLGEMANEMMEMGSLRKAAIEQLQALPKVRPLLESRLNLSQALECPDWEFTSQLYQLACAVKILGLDLLEFLEEQGSESEAAANEGAQAK